MASDPAGPVYAGEMQMPALGQDVDVGHPETGESIKHVSTCGIPKYKSKVLIEPV
jgi:acetoacetyl-CoA synthetase